MSSPSSAFDAFYNIIVKLRSPSGCPWDREQTAESLRSSILEEAHECVDAINSGSRSHILEEIGDLYLLATMVGYIFEQDGSFSVSDTLNGASEKLVRRHPHVFADAPLAESSDAVVQWDAIKANEKGKTHNRLLDSIPRSLPPLEKAFRIQKKVAKVGFDWKEPDDILEKVREEIEELLEARSGRSTPDMEEEIGDILFTVVNLSRRLGIDPSLALHGTNRKFVKRFEFVEDEMKRLGLTLSPQEFDRMNALWEQAKNGGGAAAHDDG